MKKPTRKYVREIQKNVILHVMQPLKKIPTTYELSALVCDKVAETLGEMARIFRDSAKVKRKAEKAGKFGTDKYATTLMQAIHEDATLEQKISAAFMDEFRKMIR